MRGLILKINYCVYVGTDNNGDDDGVDGDGGAHPDDPLCLTQLACGLATPRFFLLFCWFIFILFVGLPWPSPVKAPELATLIWFWLCFAVSGISFGFPAFALLRSSQSWELDACPRLTLAPTPPYFFC